MTKEKKENQVLVVKELPKEQIRQAEDEKNNIFDMETTEEALTKLRNDVVEMLKILKG
jgi:hypothetical protein